MSDRNCIIGQINELALKYSSAAAPEKMMIKHKLVELFFEVYNSMSNGFKGFDKDEITNEMLSFLYGMGRACILDKFNEGNFYAYMTRSISNRLNNTRKRDSRTDSIDDKFELSDKHSMETDYENKDEVYAYFVVLLSAEFEKHLPQKQNNPSRKLYIGLFFTEQFTEFCKTLYREDKDNPGRAALMNKEALLFDTINTAFLDHVMEKICRCIAEVSDSEYKQNLVFDIRQSPEKRICYPFDAKVFITFLKKELNKSVSNAVITQQRGNYRELMKTICGN